MINIPRSFRGSFHIVPEEDPLQSEQSVQAQEGMVLSHKRWGTGGYSFTLGDWDKLSGTGPDSVIIFAPSVEGIEIGYLEDVFEGLRGFKRCTLHPQGECRLPPVP